MIKKRAAWKKVFDEAVQRAALQYGSLHLTDQRLALPCSHAQHATHGTGSQPKNSLPGGCF